MNEVLGLIRSYGVARLGAIVGVTIGVAIALGLIVLRIGEPPMSVLYADLDLADARAVVERLEQDGVRHALAEKNGQVAIMAPRAEIARLKLMLAGDGVMATPGVGYEIFDEADMFGATQFQQNMSRLRALEGELGRTIATIAGVRAARVHLVLPERDLFSRDENAASASIVVDAPAGLPRRSVKAIVNLAASAVPGLAPTGVTVLDASGALLAAGGARDDALGPVGANAEEKTAAVEARLRRMVEDIVGPIVGRENMRVQVAADIDFNRVTENAEIIDPDSQTVLSSSLVEEASNDARPDAARGVSVANALPGAAPVAEDGASVRSSNRRTEETTNYEISRTVRQEVREGGGVKRLSVAVALAAGDAPRSDAEIDRITSLVRAAVGFDAARGDAVNIVEAPFAARPDVDGPAPGEAPAPLAREDVMRLFEIAALALIGLALVFYVLRPLFMRGAPQADASAQAALEAAGSEARALPAPADGAPGGPIDQKIDLARVEGQVRASSLKQVAEVVKGHTDESAGILKSWIREAS